ncbi:hypothetical protein [Cellulomonas sp. Leaf334]|uniref:DUF6881 domain-containing protein n=1 Tax=Cellulomonas sp. Leaf334 TaxID=1736339 RepID=UPI0006FD3627|nr:hypothetical protein [Cellulomonas sp. Leaf334]KQR17181.1 hypothetical protein ASF78_07720 [Cellulomonas sp. Leaf334]
MTTRYYQRVRWLHDDPDDPVLLWAEVVDGWEVRKVDEFVDGHLVWADGEKESESTVLGTAPVPAPEEIAQKPQFLIKLVDRETFERVWQRALASGK